ncbi:MAG TPA: ParB/RepB/Spo0J family partition protein [Chitinophagales bacterium]|nr:ParB/RepB/Spo0J family partition protein [Chitinophagales bacterium]
MAKKKFVGSGIRALLSDMNDDDVIKINEYDVDSIINTVSKISLEDIEVNPFQPRVDFNENALKDLANSIRIHGVIQPITVRKIGAKKFQLIAGERRLRASKMAGQNDIPAYVRETNDQESLEIALIENIQREDLNAMEISINYQRLIDECQLTHETLGGRLGKDRSTITNYLRLLKLPAEIQHALKARSISMGHARALITIADIEKQIIAFKEVESKGLSVRKTEELVRNLNNDTKTSAPKSAENKQLPPAYVQVQSRLTDALETKVRIKKGVQDKGEIIIPFYSAADLERLIEMLED